MANNTKPTKTTVRKAPTLDLSGDTTHPFDLTVTDPDPAIPNETPTQKLDRVTQTAAAGAFGNLSPITMSLAVADWAWHLAASPGRQLELATRAAQLMIDLARSPQGASESTGSHDDDPRFRAEEWAEWPFSYWRAAFRTTEAFWKDAVKVPGVNEHHAQIVDFYARQWLGMLTPANRLLTNPVVLNHTLQNGGANLLQGAKNWVADLTQVPTAEDVANKNRFVVGKNMAVTPGKVVYRNHLIELIRYTPQTDKVHPEPVLMIPSWIMKYYILDLSPHNSMVDYLVKQGHTVYMLSWRNPDGSDRELSMEDYLEMGVFEAMRNATQDFGADNLHLMGYCLGGTLAAIAAAALSRQDGAEGYADVPPPLTLSLLAAQVDFTEPGELGLFIDEGQINLLDHMMRNQGYLTGKQMAGTFQFLHSRDLIWSRQMREYLMGERAPSMDLMAWNADTTRMPARMHYQYLYALFLKNALANGRYMVGDNTVSLNNLKMPIFLVGTERDHVSPWRSVYKLHLLTSTEITFALTSGGHNAGIVSEPGHPRRHYAMSTRPTDGHWIEANKWQAQAQRAEGSWWPAWQNWLAERSSTPIKAKRIAARSVLADAPGEYVMQHFPEP